MDLIWLIGRQPKWNPFWTTRDEDKTDATMRLSYGILGDLACTFPHGQITQQLSAQWITTELRSKSKMPGETKKISKWAREVSIPAIDSFWRALCWICSDDQNCYTLRNSSQLSFGQSVLSLALYFFLLNLLSLLAFFLFLVFSFLDVCMHSMFLFLHYTITFFYFEMIRLVCNCIFVCHLKEGIAIFHLLRSS